MPTPPYLTLDTPPPYHFGGTIDVSTHGDIRHESRLTLFAYQAGVLVYVEDIDASAEGTYTLHFGTDGGSNQWVASGGGAADCTIRFLRVGSVGKSYEPYTLIDIHVEA